MSTLQERMQFQVAPAILTPALFEKRGDSYAVVKMCTYEESIAQESNGLVAGFIDEENGIWELPDRWLYDNGTRERLL